LFFVVFVIINYSGKVMSVSVSGSSILHKDYIAEYGREEDLSCVVARILDAEGKDEALKKIRDELAPKNILTPMGEALRNINPEVFTTLFGKDAVFASEPAHASKVEEKQAEKTQGYAFQETFIRDVQQAFGQITSHSKIQEIKTSKEHKPSFETLQKEVEKIWTCKHKSRDGASSVLQSAYEILKVTFGEEVKKERLYTLIAHKMSDLVEEALDETDSKEKPVIPEQSIPSSSPKDLGCYLFSRSKRVHRGQMEWVARR
jgi:hypothetical protein